MKNLAAIDCGTNTTRLLITNDAGMPLCRELVTTRLGRGLDDEGNLSVDAIERTSTALRKFAQLLETHEVGLNNVAVVATSAARDAPNGAVFLDDTERALGVRPTTISGIEEGRLAFAGATAPLEPGAYLMVDIGGGSTELVAGVRGSQPQVTSLDVGCVRLTEQYLHSDPYTTEQLASAERHARAAFEALMPTVLDTPPRALIGVAGTVTTAASIDLGITTYAPDAVSKHQLTGAAIQAICDSLALMRQAERQTVAGLPSDRADVIVAGLLILRAVMAKLAFESCQVSDSDLLNGLISRLQMGNWGSE